MHVLYSVMSVCSALATDCRDGYKRKEKVRYKETAVLVLCDSIL